jgi:hypothetical protein
MSGGGAKTTRDNKSQQAGRIELFLGRSPVHIFDHHGRNINDLSVFKKIKIKSICLPTGRIKSNQPGPGAYYK